MVLVEHSEEVVVEVLDEVDALDEGRDTSIYSLVESAGETTRRFDTGCCNSDWECRSMSLERRRGEVRKDGACGPSSSSFFLLYLQPHIRLIQLPLLPIPQS